MTRHKGRKFRFATRKAAIRLAVLALLLVVGVVYCYLSMIRMPGRSYTGPLPPLTDAQALLAEQLQHDVTVLAEEIGPRNTMFPVQYQQAEAFLRMSLDQAGYKPQRDVFESNGMEVANIIAERPGGDRADEIIVIGAHYDSVDDCPAANDNGSGVAATLALARAFADASPSRTIRFVLFANEEPPQFQTREMGSFVYASRCRERGDNIVAMISLETIGYYRDQPGSQQYPVGLLGLAYPTQGNFIAFVGNWSSRYLVKEIVGDFREHAQFPSEGAALPGWIEGVGWSDHWAFWQAGYPAVMATDTAPYRYPWYHTGEDTPDKLDYEKLARVVTGVEAVLHRLALTQPPE